MHEMPKKFLIPHYYVPSTEFKRTLNVGKPVGVPQAVRRLLLRCLQKEAKGRLQHIGEFAAASLAFSR
jgi:hypothetical protein